MSVTMIGLDTAKSVFQLHGVDAGGREQLRRKLRRSELIPFFAVLCSKRHRLMSCDVAGQP